jgi:uncharacterized membrane protein
MDLNILVALKQFVTATKLHPILVNFTAALIPVSIVNDLLAVYFKNQSLRDTAWWTLLYATIMTPLTVISGWLFWMKDDNGVAGMTVHKWLGTVLIIPLVGLFVWRWQIHRQHREVSAAYFVLAVAIIILLVVQGYLGGEQVFSGM